MDLYCQGSIAFTSGGGNMEGITTVREVTSISWVIDSFTIVREVVTLSWVMECLTTVS